MRGNLASYLSVACLLLGLSGVLAGQALGQEAAEKPFGLSPREPWTSSRVVGSPEPPAPYATQRLFSGLQFNQSLEMTHAPGTERLFVAEHMGKIFSFKNQADVADADLFLDLTTLPAEAAQWGTREICGLEFHPDYQKNGYVFVCYNDKRPKPARNCVSRFVVNTKVDPPVADPLSETLILEWHSAGHNGGCIKFGPDGMLYIVTGDGSGIADEYNTGQYLGDLLSSVLRIDVNRVEGGLQYGIPADNPFVDLAGARPEVWAFGLRNPWKMSFDRGTGQLWTCEVGQDLWEMVYLIERGGNYGWSVTEGRYPFRTDRAVGPTPILPPVTDHPHSEARSLTGGFVYRGSRLPELVGAYIYGDYDTGKIWGLRWDATQRVVTWRQELVDTPLRIVGFSEDNAGELYILTYQGEIHQLVPAPVTAATSDFPRRLSETGLFASTKDHQPATGLFPYSVNAPLWSDNAHKERFVALPGNSQIDYRPDDAWEFPEGTVLVKTFSLEMEQGNPASGKRLETRLMHLEQGHWRGYTYLWNDEQTDAELLAASGADRTYQIADPAAEGGQRAQTWHFPSRAECTLCHTMPARFVLGLSTAQMNKDHDYGGVIDNQIRAIAHAGVFKGPVDRPIEQMPRLADPLDASADLNHRARSYLHGNCAHCHMKYGGGNARFELRHALPLAETLTVDAVPEQGTLGIADARLLAPGDVGRSLIHHRMTRLGQGHMPHVGSNVIDTAAVDLIGAWIKALPETLEKEKELARIKAWEPEIALFDQQDTAQPPTAGGIVFVGSSSIRLWDLPKSFPDLPVTNRGFGGSQMADSLHYVDRLVLRHRPRAVVVYAGDNDLAGGKHPEQVAADFRNFVKVIHTALPETKVVYIAVKPSIARWKMVDRVRATNRLIEEFIAQDKRLAFVDVDAPMLDAVGQPRKELFQADGLHLNDAGYQIWTELVMSHLR